MKAFNPFTRSLTGRARDTAFGAFVERWDAVEALVIRVYRGERATETDEAEWRSLRAHVAGEYPRWRKALDPHWRAARAAGEPASEDPFLLQLSRERAELFVGDWRAMQFLPAAREAINRLLIASTQARAPRAHNR